ncbi:hypothetical protein J1N35_025419 [Gossypium stocksii]|uniref:Uncharacterized protein n=1 Tax=Gossypium stocksii TaxID=47602 RepID=A0A9D3V6K2_9ROSI|nr:hypothetical protein J1N35_025419 [Gossypium stocksii]
MGRHSLVLALDFNFGAKSIQQLRYTRRDDVLLTTCTREGSSSFGHAIGVDNKEGSESDNNPILESQLDGSKIALFYESKLIPIEPEDGGSNCEDLGNARGTYPNFKGYAPPTHMHSVNLNAKGVSHPKNRVRRN